MRDASLSEGLLAWYDAHARVLPWRVAPEDRAAGVMPDPYRVWLSEIMLQQTTVAAVRDYFRRFTNLWPTVGALAAAEAICGWAIYTKSPAENSEREADLADLRAELGEAVFSTAWAEGQKLEIAQALALAQTV